jgi:hypothetical protein
METPTPSHSKVHEIIHDGPWSQGNTEVRRNDTKPPAFYKKDIDAIESYVQEVSDQKNEPETNYETEKQSIIKSASERINRHSRQLNRYSQNLTDFTIYTKNDADIKDKLDPNCIKIYNFNLLEFILIDIQQKPMISKDIIQEFSQISL